MAENVRQLVFIGASAFPEIVELVRDINAENKIYEMRGILDDNVALHGTEVEGVPVLGPLSMTKDFSDVLFVFCIGSYRSRVLRHELLQRMGLPPERFATLIHPSAKIYASSSVGEGCIIHKGTVVVNNTVIEPFVIMAYNVVIGGNNLVGRGALIASHTTTNSGVRIGSYSFIGSGTVIAGEATVGPGAMLSAGSVVFRDIPPGVFQFGNPPKMLERIVVADDILQSWKESKERN